MYCLLLLLLLLIIKIRQPVFNRRSIFYKLADKQFILFLLLIEIFGYKFPNEMFFIQISNKNHNQIEFKMILKHIFICFFSLFLLIFILVFRIHFPTLNNMVAFVTATTTACNYDYFYKCFSCSGIKNIELN